MDPNDFYGKRRRTDETGRDQNDFESSHSDENFF